MTNSTEKPATSSLLERLAVLRAQSNLSSKDEESKNIPFPAACLLRMYCKCRTGENSLYLNNFEGLKLLVDWLSPINISEPQKTIHLEWYQINYEILQLAQVLQVQVGQITATLDEIYSHGN